MDALWQKATGRLRETLGQVGYETWIGPLNFVGLQGKTAVLEAPNKFFRDWVNERYIDVLRQSLSAEAGDTLEVNLTFNHRNGNGHSHGNGHGNGNGVIKDAPARATGARVSSNESQIKERRQQLNPRYTLAEFVVGSGNQFAHAAALAVANQPG